MKALFWTLLICVAAVVFYKFADGKMREVERVRAAERAEPADQVKRPEPAGRKALSGLAGLPVAPAPFER